MRRALALVLALAASIAWADPTHFSGPVDSRGGFTVDGQPCISSAGTLAGTCATFGASGDPGNIQFNNAGALGGDPLFTTDGVGNVSATSVKIAGQPCISSAGALVGTCAAGGGGSVTSVTVDLTTTQIATLGSTPINIVPAQGTGTVVIPVAASLQYLAGTEPFAFTPTLSLRLSNGGDAIGRTWKVLEPANGFALTGIVSQVTVFSALEAGGNTDQIDAINTPLFLTTNVGLVDPGFSGSILTASVGGSGSGYAATDTGTIVNPHSGTTATYVVDSVDGGGAVLTFHIATPGTQYGVAPFLATTVTTGAGDGAFSVNVDTITPLSDGVGRIEVLYYVMTLR